MSATNGGGTNLNQVTSTQINSTTAKDEWIQVTGTGTIATGAQSLRMILSHNTTNSTSPPRTGTVYFDDIHLEIVPEPATGSLLAAGAILLTRRGRRQR